MDQNFKEKTLENITKAEAVSVLVSKAGGFDGLAAGLALYLSLTKLEKKVNILAQAPTVSDARRLYGVDYIGKTEKDNNLVIVINDAVATVDKVTYFLDKNKLKIVIHPLAGSKGASQEQITYEQSARNTEMVFLIGYKTKEELEQEITHEQLISSDNWIVNINIGNLDQKFTQVTFSNPEGKSLSEVTAQMIRELALPLDEDISYNLFAGIAQKTNNFSPYHSNSSCFEIASWLMKFGAGKASLAQNATKLQAGQKAQSATNFYTSQSPNPVFEHVSDIDEKVINADSEQDWLTPPKIYKGSKSFDREN